MHRLLVQVVGAAKPIGQPVKAEVRQALMWPRRSESEHLFPATIPQHKRHRKNDKETSWDHVSSLIT